MKCELLQRISLGRAPTEIEFGVGLLLFLTCQICWQQFYLFSVESTHQVRCSLNACFSCLEDWGWVGPWTPTRLQHCTMLLILSTHNRLRPSLHNAMTYLLTYFNYLLRWVLHSKTFKKKMSPNCFSLFLFQDKRRTKYVRQDVK